LSTKNYELPLCQMANPVWGWGRQPTPEGLGKASPGMVVRNDVPN